MSGGYRKYLQNILPRMAKHDDVEAILCATPKSIGVQDWFDPMPNVRFVSCKPFRFLFSGHDADLLRELEKFLPDVIFVPVERSFRFRKVPVVNMIQNMEPFVSINGNPLRERFRTWLRRLDARKALKRSNKIIAPSEYIRDFLLHNLNVHGDKIGLVYHGVDLPENKDAHRPDIIPKGWDGQFFFTAGSIRPARGLEDLLLALKHLSAYREKSIRLVIAGESGYRMVGYQKKLKSLAQNNNLSNRICWTGNLNEKEMAWCYKNSQAFIMTSRVESFGMIGVEAMAHGCICVSANSSCLPEIFRDAAIYYPPRDAKALAEVIKTLLVWDNDQCKIMSEKAKRRAAEFSWDICAEKTVAVLAKAARQ